MAYTKVTGALVGSLSDLDLTNVGDIQLDSISGDADTNTSITFSGSDVITIATGGSGRLTIGDGALSPVTDNQIDLGTSSLEFKDGYFDGTVTADAFAGPLTGNVTGTADVATVATTVTITDNENTNETNAIIFTAGGDVDGGNLGLESDGNLTYNPSSGTLTATAFAGNITGNVTGNASGTAATVTGAAQTNITSLGTLTALTVDNMAFDANTLTSTGTFIIDSDTDITLDADGGDIRFKDGGTTISTITNSSNSLQIKVDQQDADFIIKGDDGGSEVTPFFIDMSTGGRVGINQTSPSSALHITGSGDTKIIIEDGSDEQSITAHSGGLNYGVVSGDAHTFVVAGTDAAVIDSGSARVKQTAITSSSNSIAWDAKAAANAYHITTENTTFAAPSNAVEGAVISVELAQGGTARTIAWNTVFEFAASTAPTVTATANKTDIFTFRYNGSVWQEIGRVQNMAQT